MKSIIGRSTNAISVHERARLSGAHGRQFGRIDLENDKIACRLILAAGLLMLFVADDDDRLTAGNKLGFRCEMRACQRGRGRVMLCP